MTRWLWLPLALAGCGSSDEDIAIALVEDAFRADLPAGMDSRTVDLYVEAPAAAQRSGTVGMSLRVAVEIVVPDTIPWQDVALDVFLFGRSVDEEHVTLPRFGAYELSLQQPIDTECVLGESCTWHWSMRFDRGSSGVDDIFLQGQVRGLLNLGPEIDAPTDWGELRFYTEGDGEVEDGLPDDTDTDTDA